MSGNGASCGPMLISHRNGPGSRCTSMNCLKYLSFFPLAMLMALPLRADTDYASHPEARAFIREMARDHAYDAERLRHWLGEARPQERIIELISKPAERTFEWHQYRDLFIKPERIERGAEFIAEYEDAFARAESEYGVSREIIGAIIGVETWYGRYRGEHRVLDALATLAFDYPPRSRFFRSELKHFFLMAREQGFEPDALKGSYAGAMGYGQFISSSYRNFAVDFDGDDIADIFENPVDAIGSVANYFSEHDWRPGGPVAFRLTGDIVVPDSLLTSDLRPVHTVADYRNAGIPVPEELAASEPARMLKVQGDSGPEWWLTCHNFYVITRYNHSHLYGLAVHTLAGELDTALDSSATAEGISAHE